MLAMLRKYARAFVVALQFTLRGEQPPLLKMRQDHPQMAAWWAGTSKLVDAAERRADAAGINAAARKTLMIHADKRDVSAATILATVKYHAEHEYPLLVVNQGEFNYMAIQATNLNDRYLVMRLGENVPESVKPAVAALGAHLDALPKPQDM